MSENLALDAAFRPRILRALDQLELSRYGVRLEAWEDDDWALLSRTDGLFGVLSPAWVIEIRPTCVHWRALNSPLFDRLRADSIEDVVIAFAQYSELQSNFIRRTL